MTVEEKWIYRGKSLTSHETYHSWICPKCGELIYVEEQAYHVIKPERCICGFTPEQL